ncbi:hypothetical protein [Pseudomonas mercuritolerans]|uniref:Dermonecrotic toxin n=1 Tax=Pseudomonas mercuritolerans TaxID=2951809 RepID=A0ABT2Y2W3_9PSED|nr:hypothetical protein [Pseudomonas mercuritolerans]MCV2225293.1 hypothetical protein [Pseudomonas mercuritolerans]
MIDLKKDKIFRPAKVTLAGWQYQSAADAMEREQVLAHLEQALDEYNDDQIINWYAREVELQPGSSLHDIYNPGRLLLAELLETGPVVGALAREEARDHDGLLRVSPEGKMEVRADRGWVDLVAARHFEFSQPTRSALMVIADIADVAGGFIWPDLDVTLDQWFKFHDIDLPDNNAKVRNLLGLFRFAPEVKEPGDYWEHFQTTDDVLAALSEEQFSEIRKATAKLMPKRKLLTALYNVSGRAAISDENAAQRIAECVEHPIALALAGSYLKELNWYGVNEGQAVCANTLHQLLITAVLLDLDPSIGNSHSINRRDLYSPGNLERHPSEIRDEYVEFVRNKRWIDPELSPLVAHLLLARNAPEFLVSEVPATVTLGSIAWINLTRAVALVEAAKAGASRVMTYAQIIAYGELEAVSEAQKHLRDLAMIDPIVDWALLNRIIARTELEQSEEASTRLALDAFERHSEQFAQVARAFSTPLPNRAEIARTQLKKAAPGCDTLDEKALSEQGGQQVMSMVDLHQSGDMATGEWDRRTVRLVNQGLLLPAIDYNPSGISLYTRYPGLLKLDSCELELDRQLAAHFKALNSGMLSAVKLALAQMPEADLQIFMNAGINFFTVRESAVYVVTRRAGGPLGIGVEQETLQSRDAATGRFGIVMYASHENAELCYELFTSRAETRKNDALGALIKRERKFLQRSRISASANMTLPLTRTATQRLPLNIKRYTHAAAEDTSVTSSMAIIDYFGELAAPMQSSELKPGFYQKFNDPAIARIAEFLVNNRPFLNRSELRELVRIPTPLELSKEEGERLLTYFIDLLVPFKKCIEDIVSGDHNKMVDGFYGCLMDGIGLVGTVAGASSKALSICAKAISTTAKAARFTRLALTSAISLFNPFDGVPSGLQAGGKLLHKGLLRFNKNSHDLILKASGQLHKISGRRQSWDLLEAADNVQLGLGSWRPRATADAVGVLAARRGDKWYALNRRGNLWGQPLDGFAYHAPVQLPYSPRTLPLSYTRKFIERSLPRARAKIDNAIEVFNRHDFKRDRESLMKIVFGSASQISTDRLVNYLRLIRFDFAGFSLSNMVLDGLKINDTLASFDADNYQRWKDAGSEQGADIAFVQVYTKNLNRHFVSMGFNHDVVADDLIHELFHASAQTDDVGYASDAVHTSDDGQRLDVTELLNLAAGCLRESDTGTDCHAPSRAFENADSLALATSLLSQLATDKATFDENMTILRGALEANAGKAIGEPIVITLNKPR